MKILPFRFRAAPAWSENQCVLQMGKPLSCTPSAGFGQERSFDKAFGDRTVELF